MKWKESNDGPVVGGKTRTVSLSLSFFLLEGGGNRVGGDSQYRVDLRN